MVQKFVAMSTRTAGLSVWLVLLAGCHSGATRPDEPLEGTPLPQPSAPNSPSLPLEQPPPARPTPPPRENHLSAATRSLVAQSHTQLAQGDMYGASSTLDRALRIEPNNPLLWIERGKLRLVESDARQAESCGRKALALASGDRATQAQAGRVIAEALRKQNRNPEAAEIERQPYMR